MPQMLLSELMLMGNRIHKTKKMIIIRIIKKPYLDLMIEKLLKIGYKKDIIRSLTSKANYIYLHDDMFEICNTYRYNELIQQGVYDCKFNKEIFYAKE